MNSIILNTDSYKASHFLQYPPNTTVINSYIEARGIDNTDLQKIVFTLKDFGVVHFGLQAFIIKYLLNPITQNDINLAEEVLTAHGEPFNREGWEHILKEYNGYLPLVIESLPEGSVVEPGNALVQVRNTDPKLPWLTSYIETALLRAIWYPSSVATVSREIKRVCKEFLLETADTIDSLDFMLQDFGARGVSSDESAELGGLAHLVNFKGTDTLAAIIAARKYYQEEMAGFSIPAAEHSTITSWGKDREKDAYANMVKKFLAPGKLAAVVSDSYDIYYAVDKLWGEDLKDLVVESGGRLVIRPDSGEPATVVPRIINSLGSTFGFTSNNKGYKVLHPSVRAIQGDGVNINSIYDILTNLRREGWSAENVVFGMGGALLQKVNRDTFKYAMKASAAIVDGQWIDVFKDPVTDQGKRSKKGVLAVRKLDNKYETVRRTIDVNNDLLSVVYEMDSDLNAPTFYHTPFSTIRERAKV